MKKRSSFNFIILASTTFLIITIAIFVNFFRANRKVSISSRAAGFDRRVYGEGETGVLQFKLNLFHLERSDKDRGSFWVKTLSPDEEIEGGNFKVTDVSWYENSSNAFFVGTVELEYKDGHRETKYSKVLLIDQNNKGDYQDVLGIVFCEDVNCTSSYIPWYPWSVIEGDLIVE